MEMYSVSLHDAPPNKETDSLGARSAGSRAMLKKAVHHTKNARRAGTCRDTQATSLELSDVSKSYGVCHSHSIRRAQGRERGLSTTGYIMNLGAKRAPFWTGS